MKINELLTEQQLDELNWQDVKKGAKYVGNKLANVPGAIQRGAKSIEQGANKYTQGVQQTGNAVAGAANALGRAGAETFKQGIARPVGAAWNAGKNIAQNAAGTVQQGYGDIKQGAQALGKGVTTARQDIGNAGQWAGDELSAVGRGVKSVGQGAANVLGGAGNAIGAVASAPQGVGRSIKRGYGAGVDAIGGPSDEELAGQTSPTQTQTTQPVSTPNQSAPTTSSSTATDSTAIDPSNQINQQIAQKKSEIQDLQTQLSQIGTRQKQATQSSTASQPRQNNDSNVVADVLKGAQDAWERGAAGTGGAWGSVADQGNRGASANSLSFTDEQGRAQKYFKQGNSWIDQKTGKAVTDPTIEAMLNAHAATQSAPGISNTRQATNPPNPRNTGQATTGQATTGQATTTTPTTTGQATTTTAKPRTGGKVAGQVSQTPNAIRKRAVRAGATTTANAPTTPSVLDKTAQRAARDKIRFGPANATTPAPATPTPAPATPAEEPTGLEFKGRQPFTAKGDAATTKGQMRNGQRLNAGYENLDTPIVEANVVDFAALLFDKMKKQA